jgi:hypothetical protein
MALYRRLPFDLPTDATGLVIEIDYAKTATAALDIGLSDPRGFRGWSGSSRQHIALGPGRATPGYLAGDLPAGAWAVELGLHGQRGRPPRAKTHPEDWSGSQPRPARTGRHALAGRRRAGSQ